MDPVPTYPENLSLVFLGFVIKIENLSQNIFASVGSAYHMLYIAAIFERELFKNRQIPCSEIRKFT